MAIRIAEKLFNFPLMYRAKYAVTGLLFKLVKPVAFKSYFTIADVLETIQKGAAICEIGCGDGENLRLLRESGAKGPYCGIDVNPHMISHCREKYPVDRWLVAESISYPFADEEFDVVLIINVLHHLNTREDIVKILRETARIGKRTILIEPLQSQSEFLYFVKRLYWTITDGGNLYFRREDFSRVFADAELSVQKERWTSPLMHMYWATLEHTDHSSREN
jgi:ubiquinone/menaquinone biosynthesis C-methylase UbiE